MLKTFIEELKIKKYSFTNRLREFEGYQITWNDDFSHNLTQKMKERGINLPIKEFIEKIKKGLKEVIKQTENENNFYRKEVVVYYKKSKFILVLRITKNKKIKDIYIKTFLAYDMKIKDINLVINLWEAYENDIIDREDFLECKDNNTFKNIEFGFIEPGFENAEIIIDEFIIINE